MRIMNRWNLPRGYDSAGNSSAACLAICWSVRAKNQTLTAWAPAVDIYETENELVIRRTCRNG